MSGPRRPIPLVAMPVRRHDGNVGLEVAYRGVVIASMDVTSVVDGWFKRLGIFQSPGGVR